MAFRIVRNDIINMKTEAIVNTANDYPTVGTGCDYAVYQAAGYDELLAYRKEHIGHVPEGEVFITPGFHLYAKYIIHAVSPLYEDGKSGEEEKLRSCYRKSLLLAKENHIKSIAFPLISTGGFGYPKEEGMRIAIDEIYDFLFDNEMDIYLVVFDTKSVLLGEKVYPDLKAYIDHNYVLEKRDEEYDDRFTEPMMSMPPMLAGDESIGFCSDEDVCENRKAEPLDEGVQYKELKRKLDERKAHLSDSFSEYLLYLIKEKGMTNVEVYKRAIVDKKLFAKIKNDPSYHPQKLTCLCLCMGAQLNIDETKDLLARAGYALSPCDMRDVIFSYFIENQIYDMIDLDIQLEEYGIPCIIV